MTTKDATMYFGDPDDFAVFRGHSNSKKRTPLPGRWDLRNHSMTGFAWGYAGSGPAQLALAILADATGDDNLALNLYQDFKFRKIAHLPQSESWQMSRESVLAWVNEACPLEAHAIDVLMAVWQTDFEFAVQRSHRGGQNVFVSRCERCNRKVSGVTAAEVSGKQITHKDDCLWAVVRGVLKRAGRL